MSRNGHKAADTKAPIDARINSCFTAIEDGMNARFAAVQSGIDSIGEAYNQVAEGCTDIERRLEALEHSLNDTRTRQFETTSTIKQVKGIKQKVDSFEFDIKTLINGRLNEHDKAIKEITQSQGLEDVDEVLQSVLLRLQKLEKAPSREKSQFTTANLSTTALAQGLLDRLKNGDKIEDEQLSRSLVTELRSSSSSSSSSTTTTTTQPVRHINTPPKAPTPEPEPSQLQPQRKPKLPAGMPSKVPFGYRKPDAQQIAARKHQTEAAREARARKRKRPSSSAKAGLPAEDDDGARSSGVKRSRPLSSRPETDDNLVIDEGFGEGEHRRRSGRAPKPAQLAAGTVSWAEARVLTKQRLGRI